MCAFSRELSRVIYAIAFASFGVQATGLIGSEGILPVATFLDFAHRQLGAASYWRIPTLLWFSHSDAAISFLCWAGVALALITLVVPSLGMVQRGAFALLYALYLSLVSGGQEFMGFQWDALLLEAGFLAIFIAPDWGRVWLFRWLLFRLMLESGVAKLVSHDATWRDLTALTHHWETQPLPTPLAWTVAHAPLWFQKVSCAFVFLVELMFPFLVFGHRRLRIVAAVGFAALQVLIFLTGNYTFFNLLTLALCIPLVCRSKPGRANVWVSIALIAFTGFAGSIQLLGMFGFHIGESAIARITQFDIVDEYGLFANMTTKRNEISIEGSNDGDTWTPYVFRYKPEALNRKGVWVAPHQPRLDWQMWFAALEDPQRIPWFSGFVLRLLQGSPPVSALLAKNPFEGHPPKYIRALYYEYHMAPSGWRRELRGLYFAPVALQ